MLMGRRFAQIHGSKQHENVCLNERDADVQTFKNKWNTDWDQREKNKRDHLTRKHIGKQTDGQRHHTRKVTAHLNEEHQRRQPPDGPHKVLKVSQTVLTQTLYVI